MSKDYFKKVKRTFLILPLLKVLLICAELGQRVKRKSSNDHGSKSRILLTGRFDSKNWVVAHVRPLAECDTVSQVFVVCDQEFGTIQNVSWIVPGSRLTRIVGRTLARLATFSLMAFRIKPDLVGGFHLLFNGLFAIGLSNLLGCGSIYVCVGGIPEIKGGGFRSENSVLGGIEGPSPRIERYLYRFVAMVDLVVTMGSGAKKFIQQNTLQRNIHINPGGINQREFSQDRDVEKSIDILFVGRLERVKGLDLLLESAQILKAHYSSSLRIQIVGEGSERARLEALAQDLDIDEIVAFVGRQKDVSARLRASRVFVLTSFSEGLSLALMEALSTGVPVVATNVGDVGDVVTDGLNGSLIDDREPLLVANAIRTWIDASRSDKELAQSVAATAQDLSILSAANRWRFALESTNSIQ